VWLETGDVAAFGDERKHPVVPGSALLKEPLFAQIILVAAFSPEGEHVFVELFAVFAQADDDFIVRHAVIHHLIDAPAHFLGQACDGAGAASWAGEGVMHNVGALKGGALESLKR
jgi:hypothetical protein